MNDDELLSIFEFQSLPVDDRAEADSAAFMCGCKAVERMSSTGDEAGWPKLDRNLPPAWLSDPSPMEYLRYVVRPAVESGSVSRQVTDLWRDRLRGPDALSDPRVKRFLEGWRTRGMEILGRQGRV
jgi:hypothetical protein